jgi:hypothetical protein
MPYIGATVTGNRNIREYLKNARTELNFNEVLLQQAETFHLVHRCFSDPGDDWNSWRLYDKDHYEIANITRSGY